MLHAKDRWIFSALLVATAVASSGCAGEDADADSHEDDSSQALKGTNTYVCKSARSAYSAGYDIAYQNVQIVLKATPEGDPVVASVGVGTILGFERGGRKETKTWNAPNLSNCRTHLKGEGLGVGFCADVTARFGVFVTEVQGGKITKAYIHHAHLDSSALTQTPLTCAAKP